MNQGDEPEISKWASGWIWRLLDRFTPYIMGSQDNFFDPSQASSVPMFWSGRLGDVGLGLATIGASVLGVAFGSIHFIVWSSEFPFHTEFILWRTSCLAMVAVPFAATVAFTTSAFVRDDPHIVIMLLLGVPMLIAFAILIFASWLYVAARLATLIIAFTTLRSVDPATLIDVDWTTFMPHI